MAYENIDKLLISFRLRKTMPRRTLLAQLLSYTEYIDAETLWLELKRKGEQISWATTYFTLNILWKHGLVDRKACEKLGRDIFKLNPTICYNVA